MPELPEVQTIVDTLGPQLAGKKVRSVTLYRHDILKPRNFALESHLCGRKIERVDRRAKRIVFSLENSERFYIHLGMSGRLTLVDDSLPLERHTHLRMSIGDGRELRFRDARRFGRIVWVGDGDCAASLGPEPLLLRAKDLETRLRRTRRAIKAALLDQKLIAGLGNIYVDESLFDAGIHPRKPANRLSTRQASILCTSIQRVLKRAILKRGSSLRDYVDANGKSGGFQKLHRVYGREGQPCGHCGTRIRRIILGGRSTHFCPNCQSGRRVPRPNSTAARKPRA